MGKRANLESTTWSCRISRRRHRRRNCCKHSRAASQSLVFFLFLEGSCHRRPPNSLDGPFLVSVGCSRRCDAKLENLCPTFRGPPQYPSKCTSRSDNIKAAFRWAFLHLLSRSSPLECRSEQPAWPGVGWEKVLLCIVGGGGNGAMWIYYEDNLLRGILMARTTTMVTPPSREGWPATWKEKSRSRLLDMIPSLLWLVTNANHVWVGFFFAAQLARTRYLYWTLSVRGRWDNVLQRQRLNDSLGVSCGRGGPRAKCEVTSKAHNLLSALAMVTTST